MGSGGRVQEQTTLVMKKGECVLHIRPSKNAEHKGISWLFNVWNYCLVCSCVGERKLMAYVQVEQTCLQHPQGADLS